MHGVSFWCLALRRCGAVSVGCGLVWLHDRGSLTLQGSVMWRSHGWCLYIATVEVIHGECGVTGEHSGCCVVFWGWTVLV